MDTAQKVDSSIARVQTHKNPSFLIIHKNHSFRVKGGAARIESISFNWRLSPKLIGAKKFNQRTHSLSGREQSDASATNVSSTKYIERKCC